MSQRLAGRVWSGRSGGALDHQEAEAVAVWKGVLCGKGLGYRRRLSALEGPGALGFVREIFQGKKLSAGGEQAAGKIWIDGGGGFCSLE